MSRCLRVTAFCLRRVNTCATVPSRMHYLTITQYSKHFKKSRPTVYKRIREGKLHTMRVEGGNLAVLVEDTEYESVKLK